jgi:dipeptidyl aminopeptidase/acylaminoacyl peptidase
VAVVSDRDGYNEIWAMNPNGDDPIELTHKPGTFSDLDWSPDGSRLAFTRDNHIFIVSAGGGDEAQLATGVPELVSEGTPSWSPDGTAIAFAGVKLQDPATQRFFSNVYLLQLAPGSTATAITAGPSDVRPAWRPLVQGSPDLPPLVEHYLTIQSHRVALSRKGVAAIRMHCDPADACNGTIGLMTSRRVACGRGHKRRVSLGTTRLRLSPFQRATVHLRLTQRARALVRCLGTVRTRVTATLRPTGAQSPITVSRSIGLRAAR